MVGGADALLDDPNVPFCLGNMASCRGAMHGNLQFILDRVHEAGKLIVCMNVSERNYGIVAHPENAINCIEELGVLHTWQWHGSSRAAVEDLGDACHVGNAEKYLILLG